MKQKQNPWKTDLSLIVTNIKFKMSMVKQMSVTIQRMKCSKIQTRVSKTKWLVQFRVLKHFFTSLMLKTKGLQSNEQLKIIEYNLQKQRIMNQYISRTHKFSYQGHSLLMKEIFHHDRLVNGDKDWIHTESCLFDRYFCF